MIDEVFSRASNGDTQAIEELLSHGYANLHDRALIRRIGMTIYSTDTSKLGPRAAYATAGLLINSGEDEASYKILRDLAWDVGYGPAQWRLGRMLANRELVLEDADREVGFELLRTARSNGHLRANQSILLAMSKDKPFPVSTVLKACATLLGLRTAVLKVVFKKNDERVI